MARSDLWRKFEAGFAAVARREDARVGSGPDDLRLRAYGDYVTAGGRIGKVELPRPGPLGGRWFLSEGSSEILKAQFELLAIDAGRLLDPPPPEDVEPLEYWLHNLWIYLQENKSRYLVGEIITHVCEASAAYCIALAKKAKEEDHRGGIAVNQQTALRRRPNLDPDMRRVDAICREMIAAGKPHLEICRSLKGMPRPANAAWRHLDWEQAYLSEQFRNAVSRWISEHGRK